MCSSKQRNGFETNTLNMIHKKKKTRLEYIEERLNILDLSVKLFNHHPPEKKEKIRREIQELWDELFEDENNT